MNEIQSILQTWNDLQQIQWDWIRHEQKVRSEERFRRVFGYPGEHPDNTAYRRRFFSDSKSSDHKSTDLPSS
jgi:hypothetical protein